MMFNIHQPGHLCHRLLHLLLRHTVILQSKGDILPNRQADELTVRILQYRAHCMT